MTTFQRIWCSLSVALLAVAGASAAGSSAKAQDGYRALATVPWLGTGVDLFAIDGDTSIEHRFQREPGGDFAGFEHLPEIPSGAVEVAALELADGRFEVFVIDRDQALWHSLQPTGSWDWRAWEQLDDDSKQVAVARAASGRVELFVIGGDDIVWHRGRASDEEGFGTWSALDLEGTQLAAAASDSDGFELAVVGLDLAVSQLSLDADAQPVGDVLNLSGESFDVALARLPGGGHSLVTVGNDSTLWERRRTDLASGWGEWTGLAPAARRVALVETAAGVELFSLGIGEALSRSQLAAAEVESGEAAWGEAQTIVEASPLDSELRGRARLLIDSLDVDQDVPVVLGLRFNVDRSRVVVTSFSTVVTERFDTPFGGTTSTISLPTSGQGELLRDQGVLRLPVTLRFDQSLNLPLIEEDGTLSLLLGSDNADGQLLDAESGTVALSGSASFEGDGSTNPLDGQSCQVIVTGTLTPVP